MCDASNYLASVQKYPLRDQQFVLQSPSLVNQTLKINNAQYHFEKRLGSGAFGTVYSARNTANNEPVAVKVISLNPANRRVTEGLIGSIVNEIRMSKRLAKISPHIVHMFDFDFDPRTGRAFIVMELGQQDLHHKLHSSPRLNPQERKMLWRQLVHIADVLQERGIVHLDIKPANIIVFPGNQIKLADLGIAQKANTNIYAPNGTPPYSAPEVTRGPQFYGVKYTSKSDMWSWGAVLYRLAYSRPPTYNPPCHHPPPGFPKSRDPQLIDVLKHTLVHNVATRPDVAALIAHPYTRT